MNLLFGVWKIIGLENEMIGVSEVLGANKNSPIDDGERRWDGLYTSPQHRSFCVDIVIDLLGDIKWDILLFILGKIYGIVKSKWMQSQCPQFITY